MKKVAFKEIKVGIDFGKTIGEVEKDDPYPNSFSVLRFLLHRYGLDNIYIISKAREAMQQKTQKWLEKNNFFEETGFKKSNFIYCQTYEEKAVLVKKYQINVFIDDHIKVVQVLAPLDQVIKIIWFNPNANLKLIEKKYRMKIVNVTKWDKVIKVFQKKLKF